MADSVKSPVRQTVSGVCANCGKAVKEGERTIAYTSRIIIHEDCKHMAEEYAAPN